MRKLGCLLGLILVFSLTAAAQDAPKAEIFAGYSYLRVNPGDPVPGINTNGFSASVSFNPKPAVGIVADFGVYHASDIFDSGVSGNVTSYLFGPRIVARGRRAEPFIQVLFGGARISAEGESESGFAMALGGGIDVKATDHVAIRLIQAEYALTRFDDAITGETASQHNARISFGIVFRLGQQ